MRCSRTRNGFQPGKEVLVGLVPLNDGVERVLGELVVISVITVRSGPLRKIPEIGFVLFFEKRVLSGEAIRHRFNVLGEEGTNYGKQEKQASL